MSNEVVIGIIASIATAFFGGFFGLLKLPLTRKEREADAAMDTAKAFEILAAQIVKSGDRSDKLFDRVVAMGERQDVEREMYRQREKERETEYRANLKALEASLIDAQTEIGDLKEHTTNLLHNQDKLRLELSLNERNAEEFNKTINNLNDTIIEQGKRIATMEAQLNKERSDNTAMRKENDTLRGRIEELETEVKQLKAQQPATVATTVTAEIPDLKELVDSLTETRAEPASPVASPEEPGSVTESAAPQASESAESVPDGSEVVK